MQGISDHVGELQRILLHSLTSVLIYDSMCHMRVEAQQLSEVISMENQKTATIIHAIVTRTNRD